MTDEPGREPLRTLFGVRLADPRARRQLPVERTRVRARGRGAGSDVRRARVLVAAALGAAIAATLAYLLMPPSDGGTRGALALPHRTAALACAACHHPPPPGPSAAPELEPRAAAAHANDAHDPPRDAAFGAPRKACLGCHGAHPSTRAGHQKLVLEGKLGCVRCHDIHGDDGGVRFDPEGSAVRYGVGRASTEAPIAWRATGPTTVPVVPLGRCLACHLQDPATAAADPILRCLLPGWRSDRAQAPTVCFDEHQTLALLLQTPTPKLGGGKNVCAAQHTPERVLAWEAAREVLALAPGAVVVVEPATVALPGLWWLGASVLGALVGLVGYAGLARIGRRLAQKSKRASAPLPALGPGAAAPAARGQKRLPVIDAATCLGCYACVDACPYDVFKVERYVAEVANPAACCGLTLCEQACPNGSLVVREADEPAADAPLVQASLESVHAPGVFLAGDVTGLPLIKNAIVQGSRALDALRTSLAAGPAALRAYPHDVVIVGAGPAGISAALRAKELGVRYRVIEQASVAHSIKSFPRGKLVFDQPLDLPLTGKLWLEECTKEELCAKWLRLVRAERLAVDEGVRLVSLEREKEGGFSIEATDADGAPLELRSARVLLCVGMRGSPRKLAVPIAPEVESRVHYHLADARTFAGQRVVVVGAGDVALETAIALARQPGCRVTLCHRGETFVRGKRRNIAEVERLAGAGSIAIAWRSEVAAVQAARAAEPLRVELRTLDGQRNLSADALFVMIGAIPPLELLQKSGVLPPDARAATAT